MDLSVKDIELFFSGEGADVGVFFHRVADFEALDFFDKSGNESIVVVLVDIDAFDGTARLSGVIEGAIRKSDSSAFGVGIVANVGGIFAAEFELDFDQTGGDRLGDLDACGVGACKENPMYRECG